MFRSVIVVCAMAAAMADPTKSPSSGIHKPTWKPSSKPAEHRTLTTREDRMAQKVNAETHAETAFQDKIYESTVNPELKPIMEAIKEEEGTPEQIAILSAVPGAESTAHSFSPAGGNLMATGGKIMTSSYKAGTPTKSPSSGIHKPTWKPSSKPNEHRKLAVSPSKSPSSGIHKPTWKPSSKPNEHRTLKVNDAGDEVDCPPKEGEEASASAGKKSSKQGASFILDAPEKQLNLMATGGKIMTSSYKAGTPTKSPSSGIHKPTWKPSSNPNEHRKLGSAAMKAAAKSSSSKSDSSSTTETKKTESAATKKTISSAAAKKEEKSPAAKKTIVASKAKTTVMDHAEYEKIVAQDKKEIKAAKKEVATPTGKIALKSLIKATGKMEKLAKTELKGDKKLRRV